MAAGPLRWAIVSLLVALLSWQVASLGSGGNVLLFDTHSADRSSTPNPYTAASADEVPQVPFDGEEMFDAAHTLLTSLRRRRLNVITAESLTSGMIISTLVDVPLFGPYIYGGFSVYDSDAKRMFLTVQVPDVYTEVCAREMAHHALRNSRAFVSIAVTGHAGPVFPQHFDVLGRVDIAVSLRTKSGSCQADSLAQHPELSDICDSPLAKNFSAHYITLYQRTNFCNSGTNATQRLCQAVQREMDAHPLGFASLPTIRWMRTAIRRETTMLALQMADLLVNGACNETADPNTPTGSSDQPRQCPPLEPLPSMPYDGHYRNCFEPSIVIDCSLATQDAGNSTCSSFPLKPSQNCPDKAPSIPGWPSLYQQPGAKDASTETDPDPPLTPSQPPSKEHPSGTDGEEENGTPSPPGENADSPQEQNDPHSTPQARQAWWIGFVIGGGSFFLVGALIAVLVMRFHAKHSQSRPRMYNPLEVTPSVANEYRPVSTLDA